MGKHGTCGDPVSCQGESKNTQDKVCEASKQVLTQLSWLMETLIHKSACLLFENVPKWRAL